MELPVSLQLRELLLALALGLGFGAVYDLGRPLRRGRVLTAAADGLYVLSVLVCLLVFKQASRPRRPSWWRMRRWALRQLTQQAYSPLP